MLNSQIELWENLKSDNNIIQVQEYIKKSNRITRIFGTKCRKHNVIINRRSWGISKSD